VVAFGLQWGVQRAGSLPFVVRAVFGLLAAPAVVGLGPWCIGEAELAAVAAAEAAKL